MWRTGALKGNFRDTQQALKQATGSVSTHDHAPTLNELITSEYMAEMQLSSIQVIISRAEFTGEVGRDIC